jgi:hypothetical protein
MDPLLRERIRRAVEHDGGPTHLDLFPG